MLLDASAAVVIDSGVVQAASVSLNDLTASLALNGVFQNAIMRLQGGQRHCQVGRPGRAMASFQA